VYIHIPKSGEIPTPLFLKKFLIFPGKNKILPPFSRIKNAVLRNYKKDPFSTNEQRRNTLKILCVLRLFL